MTNNSNQDLSAAVDVYSDWIDACDAVAKEAAGASTYDAPLSYTDPVTGAGGRRNSGSHIERHQLVAVVEDEDGQGNYNDD